MFHTDLSHRAAYLYQARIEYRDWGVQQQIRKMTSCDLPGALIFFILFHSLFEDILLTKSCKKIKKEQKRSKRDKGPGHDLSLSFLFILESMFLTKSGTKTSNLRIKALLKKN